MNKPGGILLLLLILTFSNGKAGDFYPDNNSALHLNYTLSNANNHLLSDSEASLFHNDSIHKLDFRYPYERRGLKPYIAPAILITAGTTMQFFPGIKTGVRDFAQENFAYHGPVEDYIQYAPLISVYILNAFGVEGKNNFGNRTALAFKSFLLRQIIVSSLKSITKVQRPNGDMRSFPSGHASFAFAMAHFMHHEYEDKSVWYSVGAYTCASAVAIMRVAKNAHWISDVVAGAGIGILSTELVYLTHQYKWDKDHLKNWDIFPFQVGDQKGVTMVYTF